MPAQMLVADDRRPESVDVVRTGVDVATRLGLPVTVLHVVTHEQVERFRAERPADSGYLDSLLDRVRDELQRRVQGALDGTPSSDVSVKALHGDVAEVVVAELNNGDYDYAAIGVRNRSRVGKLVFGSTAQSILLLSDRPVLTVPIERVG